MKKNYKINLNPKPVSSEEIAKFKDFDALLEQYHQAKPPTPKVFNMRSRVFYITSIAAAAMLAFVLYVVIGFGETYTEKENQYFAQRDYVDPPMVNVKPQFASYKCNANNCAERSSMVTTCATVKKIVPAIICVRIRGKPDGTTETSTSPSVSF